MADVALSLAGIQQRIRAACRRAGRDEQSVTLVAVSKGQDAGRIREAYAAGQRDFGENYAQELRDKAAELADLADIRWHFMGGLQSNKVKYVAPVTTVLHSLDRASVAEELEKRLSALNRRLHTLLEVNVGDEAQKHGLAPGDVGALLGHVRALSHLSVVGLMCVPPIVEDPEGSRGAFRRLRELALKLSLPELSMGMSHDFEVAIEEGATWVRVGTAIFGERQRRTA